MRILFSVATGLALVLLVSGCNRLTSNTFPLAKTARLEVYLASPTGTPNSRAVAHPDTGAVFYLTDPPVVTTSEVVTIQRSGESPDLFHLTVNLSPAGARKLAAATTPVQGQMLAVVVNGDVVSVAKVMSPMSNSFSVGGGAVTKHRESIFEALTRE